MYHKIPGKPAVYAVLAAPSAKACPPAVFYFAPLTSPLHPLAAGDFLAASMGKGHFKLVWSLEGGEWSFDLSVTFE
jgi:hypothetical protein